MKKIPLLLITDCSSLIAIKGRVYYGKNYWFFMCMSLYIYLSRLSILIRSFCWCVTDSQKVTTGFSRDKEAIQFYLLAGMCKTH